MKAGYYDPDLFYIVRWRPLVVVVIITAEKEEVYEFYSQVSIQIWELC